MAAGTLPDGAAACNQSGIIPSDGRFSDAEESTAGVDVFGASLKVCIQSGTSEEGADS
jgi:hypothetical protein